MFRNFDSSFRQRTDRSQSRQVVESHQRRELLPLLKQFVSEAVAALEPGIGVERIRQLQHQSWIDLEACSVSELLHSAPAWCAIDEHLRPANESDLAMAELVQMFQCHPPAGLVVHHDGAYRVA